MLHKDGVKADPRNWRPIALISLGEKLLGLVILRRIEEGANRTMDKRQKGCRRGLSCRHAVFELLRDVERCNKEGKKCIYAFIDFAKAFDSLSWPKMHLILRLQGMPENICRILRDMYDRNARVRIRLGKDKSADPFKQRCGIRQGSALSPLLFAICVDWAMRQFAATMEEEKMWTAEQSLGQALAWLGYVDDLVVKEATEADAEFAMQELASACRYIGLDMNIKKTKVMMVNQQAETRRNPMAMLERCVADGAEGWMVDWSGLDWDEQWSGEVARISRTGLQDLTPTHAVVWDNPELGVTVISSKQSGWATTHDGDSIRLTRLGLKKFALEDKNEFVCDKCGDVLADATALHFHKATGFCRQNKSIAELRTLRVGRQVEEKKKQKPRPVPAAGGKQINHHGKPVEAVGVFRYLGTEIGCDGSTDAEAHRRCGMAGNTVQQLSQVWRDKTVPTHLKADLLRSLSLSVALYNSECWSVTPATETSLRKYQDNALRIVLGGHFRNEHRGREEMCAELGVQLIEDELRHKRIGWIAHACRGDEQEGSVKRIEQEIRSKTKWGKQAQEDLEMYNMPLEVLKETKPTAIAVRATLASKRKILPVTRPRGVKAGRPKTEKRTAMEGERRERLEQQRQETEAANRAVLVRINGKAWTQRPRSKYNFQVQDDGGSLVFRVSSFYFCENTGTEEATVLGRIFTKNREQGTWACADADL